MGYARNTPMHQHDDDQRDHRDHRDRLPASSAVSESGLSEFMRPIQVVDLSM
jgi:hypothetical protein